MAAREQSLLLRTMLAGVLVLCACAAPDRPNVLVVMVDDLGYGELGSFGRAESRTPHMDRLAAEGMRFTRHYSESTCAPTRVALLTGRYPARAGYRPSGRGLPQESTTLAELLREHGYATRHIGKWHLGGTGVWGLNASPPSALPSAHGFDHWFGFLDSFLLKGQARSSAGQVLRPRYVGGRYQHPWLLGSDAQAAFYDGHLTDILTDSAVDFLRAQGERPWFLNLWYLAPHGPIEPHSRYAAQHPATPAGRYAALIQQLDENIGRLLAALAETRQDSRTLIVFLSDNGGTLDDDPLANHPLRGRKGEYDEGGIRTPLVLRWPERIPAGGGIDSPVSTLDVYPTVAALVGAKAQPGLDGLDLSPLLAGGELPPRPLFWEQQLPADRSFYSVLSSDGRRRLVRHGDLRPRLLDLELDPTGGTDVRAKYPKQVKHLTELYRVWRRDVARSAVQLRTIDADGRGFASGDDLQRTPGWGGFTFAIGLTPSPQTGGGNADEVVAHQRNVWELVRTPRNALRVRVTGEELSGRKLRIGVCSAVVFTARFYVPAYRPTLQGAKLTLFLDGKLQESLETSRLPQHGDLSAATRIGLAADGHTQFNGHMSPPVFLNESVGEGNGGQIPVSSLTEEVCPSKSGSAPQPHPPLQRDRAS